ncbi:MAG: porin [Planctomycetota bacterium]
MRKSIISMFGFTVLVFCLVGTVFAEDENKPNTGLLSAVGLDNIFAQAAPAPAEPEEKLNVSASGFGQFLTTLSDNANENFDVTRMRFKVKGTYDKFTMFVQLDTESSPTLLLDYNVNYKFSDKVQVKAGRFCLPFGWQTPISPYDLVTINYSQIVGTLFGPGSICGGGWGNLRDQGVYLHGSLDVSSMKLGYVAGILNGEERATSETDGKKASILRVFLTPSKGITVGLSHYDGSRNCNDPLGLLGKRDFAIRRFGLDWNVDMEQFFFKGQYMSGTENPSDMGVRGAAHNKENTTTGWFFEAGYKLNSKIHIVAKMDSMTVPDKACDSTTGTWVNVTETERTVYAAGVNYYFAKYAKLQVIFESKPDKGSEYQRALVLLGVSF